MTAPARVYRETYTTAAGVTRVQEWDPALWSDNCIYVLASCGNRITVEANDGSTSVYEVVDRG